MKFRLDSARWFFFESEISHVALLRELGFIIDDDLEVRSSPVIEISTLEELTDLSKRLNCDLITDVLDGISTFDQRMRVKDADETYPVIWIYNDYVE